jgi:hypothetical protein
MRRETERKLGQEIMHTNCAAHLIFCKRGVGAGLSIIERLLGFFRSASYLE